MTPPLDRLWKAPVRPGLSLLPPPTLSERSHRGFACLSIAVCGRVIFVVAEHQRPHPGRSYGRGVYLQDAPDDSAIREHVEVVVIPLAGWAAS